MQAGVGTTLLADGLTVIALTASISAIYLCYSASRQLCPAQTSWRILGALVGVFTLWLIIMAPEATFAGLTLAAVLVLCAGIWMLAGLATKRLGKHLHTLGLLAITGAVALAATDWAAQFAGFAAASSLLLLGTACLARQFHRDTLEQAEEFKSIRSKAQHETMMRWRVENELASFGRVLSESDNEIYTFDARTLKFIRVNKGARRNLGYSNMEIRALTPLDLKPELDREAFEAMIGPLRLGTKSLLRFETVHRRADGSRYPVDVTLQYSNVSGKPVFVAVVRDNSHRKEIEDRNRQLIAVVEQATDAIIILAPDMVIEYANPRAQKDLGRSLDELQGKNGDTLGYQRSDPKAYIEIQESLKRAETWNGHLHTESRDGDTLETDVTVSPLKNDLGEVTNYLLIGRNVSERLRLEQQLRQAQKLESIGQLAAGIAHEINTPTQFVGDNTRFLKEAFDDIDTLLLKVRGLIDENENSALASTIAQALTDADAEYLQNEIPQAVDQSLEGVQRIANIVRAMKEFSHPAQVKTSIDLNRAIESTVTVASNEWKYVADVDLRLDPDLPPVTCLPGEINQAVLNMIVNASHAISDKQSGDNQRGKITISTERDDDNVQILISDTGTGMTAQVRDRIFDPFFTTKEVGKGTGQGLSIAYAAIVEKHSGTLKVDSTPGIGTCFTIRLPLDDAANDDAAAVA